MKLCADAEGCDRPAKAKGLCRKHYFRKWRAKDRAENPTVPKPDRGCSVEGCESPHKGKGYCHRHYDQWYHRTRRKVEQDTSPKPTPEPKEDTASTEGPERDLAKIRCASQSEVKHWFDDGLTVVRYLKNHGVTSADRLFCMDAAGARSWCKQQQAAGLCIRSAEEYKSIVIYDHV